MAGVRRGGSERARSGLGNSLMVSRASSLRPSPLPLWCQNRKRWNGARLLAPAMFSASAFHFGRTTQRSNAKTQRHFCFRRLELRKSLTRKTVRLLWENVIKIVLWEKITNWEYFRMSITKFPGHIESFGGNCPRAPRLTAVCRRTNHAERSSSPGRSPISKW